MAENLKDIAAVEGQPLMEGRRMNVVMIPVAAPKAKTEKITEEVS